MTDTAIGQIILFLTTLVGFGIQIYRESRNRTWLRQDREDERAERREDAFVSAQKASERHVEVLTEVKTNTDISVQAFKEANDVNVKIADVTAALARRSGMVRSTDAQIVEGLDKLTEKIEVIQEAVKAKS